MDSIHLIAIIFACMEVNTFFDSTCARFGVRNRVLIIEVFSLVSITTYNGNNIWKKTLLDN